MSHRPTITIEIDWTPGTPTDVTDQFVHLLADHGGQTGAVERPLADPASGHVVLTISETTATDRYRIRAKSDGTTIWTGWIGEPQLHGDQRWTRWRIVGDSRETLEQTAAVSRPAGSVADTMTAIAPVAQRQTAPAEHRTINTTGPAGALLSILAGALVAELVETADGTLVAAAAHPPTRPPGTVNINAATMWIHPDIITAAQADRLRNETTVQTSGGDTIPGDTIEIADTATLFGRDGDPTVAGRYGATLDFDLSFALPDDGLTYGEFAAHFTAGAVNYGTYDAATNTSDAGTFYALDAAAFTITLGSDVDSDNRLAGTATLAGSEPPAASGGEPDVRIDPTTAWWQQHQTGSVPPYWALWAYVTATLSATATGTVEPPVYEQVVNVDSRTRWGARELRLPAWLIQTTAGAETILDSLGELRRTHELTLPLQQPTEALSRRAAALDAGDYATLNVDDPTRGIEIDDAHTLVTHRTLEITNTLEAFVRLTCLETGATANTSIDDEAEGGIATDGTTLWIVTYGNFVDASAYDAATQDRDSSKDILVGGLSRNFDAAVCDGTTLWFAENGAVNQFQRYARAYDAATQDEDSTKDIDFGQQGPNKAAASDGTTLWFIDVQNSDYARAYDAATQDRDSSKDINLTETYWVAEHIAAATDGTTFWAFFESGEANAYDIATGARDTARDFVVPTVVDGDDPDVHAAAWDGSSIWVGQNTDYVVAYPPP